jgi:hypothetical protein
LGGQLGGGDLVVAEGVGDDGGRHLQDVLADRGDPAGDGGDAEVVDQSGQGVGVHRLSLEGRSIAALARDHDVSRGAIRTAVADLLPEYTAVDPGAPAPELPVVLDMPGKVADFLRATDLEPAERATLDLGVTVRRGQGYTLRITATPAVHRQLLDRCQPLDGTAAVPAQRKREYENRVNVFPTASLR